MRIVVLNHLTLDGIMQGPGRPDEDTRGGFTHGGWAAERAGDDAIMRAWGQRLAASSGYLLGRRTYQDVLGYWNTQDSPFRDALNNAPKYIASNTLTEPLPWPNSTLLSGDIPAAVAELKQTQGSDLHIMGSGALIQSLAPHGLIDEYLLFIHPLVLVTGHRLFADGFPPPRSISPPRPPRPAASSWPATDPIPRPEPAPEHDDWGVVKRDRPNLFL